MARKTLRQRQERDLIKQQQEEEFLANPFGFNEEKSTDTRIGQLQEKIGRLTDSESIMLEIMSTFQDTVFIPDVGGYYTFIYLPKTPIITFDQFPLIACIGIFKWGFRGVNFHWDDYRNYTWQEVAGTLHVINQDEIEYMRSVPYANFLTK